MPSLGNCFEDANDVANISPMRDTQALLTFQFFLIISGDTAAYFVGEFWGVPSMNDVVSRLDFLKAFTASFM